MIYQILVVLFSLLGNAFFVGAEFGLVSARRSSIELQALNGSRAAKLTLSAMEQVSVMLAAAQLGVTLCSLLLGAVGETLLVHLLHPVFSHAGLPDGATEVISFILALAAMTYAHVVIGEMVPKNLALAGPDRTAMLLTPPLVGLVKLGKPIIYVLNAIANASVRLLGVHPPREIASTFTRDEVAGFVKESHREGLLTQDEEHLLAGALTFDERTVRSVIVPLDKLVTITPQTTLEQLEKLAAHSGFSRFPVVHEAATTAAMSETATTAAKGGPRTSNGVQLSGYVHLKDILGADQDSWKLPIATRLVRPLVTVRPRSSLRSALRSMQQAGSHLAQAVDSEGRLHGVVTLENVLEELVGHINDESQKTRP